MGINIISKACHASFRIWLWIGELFFSLLISTSISFPCCKLSWSAALDSGLPKLAAFPPCTSSTSVNQELSYSTTSLFPSWIISDDVEISVVQVYCVPAESALDSSDSRLIDDEYTWFHFQTTVNGGGPNDERRQLCSVITAPGTMILWISTAALSEVILIPSIMASGGYSVDRLKQESLMVHC